MVAFIWDFAEEVVKTGQVLDILLSEKIGVADRRLTITVTDAVHM